MEAMFLMVGLLPDPTDNPVCDLGTQLTAKISHSAPYYIICLADPQNKK